MKKRLLVISLLVLSTVSILTVISFAKELDEAKIKVRINVPAMQEINVVRPLSMDLNSILNDKKAGETIVIEDVGQVMVRSNVDWSLRLDFGYLPSDIKVSIRRSNNHRSHWQSIDRMTSISGTNGIHEISWDIKIELGNNYQNTITNRVLQTNFLLTHI